MSLHREKCQVQASLIFDMLRFLATGTFQYSRSVQQLGGQRCAQHDTG